MDTPTRGTVSLDGRELGRLNASQLTDIRKNVIGLVFQQFHLIPHLTAIENVMVAQYYHSMTDEREAMEALENVGLGDRARHLPSQLSGGEGQRAVHPRARTCIHVSLHCGTRNGLQSRKTYGGWDVSESFESKDAASS